MLERAFGSPLAAFPSTTVPDRARLWRIPVWTLKKVEQFLKNISETVDKTEVIRDIKRFTGSFVKFESVDRRLRAVHGEFAKWPRPIPLRERAGSPFARPIWRIEDLRETFAKNRRLKLDKKKTGDENSFGENFSRRPPRMTRRTRPRLKERVDCPRKQNGFCEICRISYSELSEHERTRAHVDFVKNCSNFLSLDSLIDEGADVETFLKMNRSHISNICERRSLRNIIKIQETEAQNIQRRIQTMCNGMSDGRCRQTSPRECKRSLNMSHGPSDTGHYLRSKGNSNIENNSTQRISPKESKRDILRNGSLSPRVQTERQYRINGKIEDGDRYGCSPMLKNSRPRSIRWRRPSPDSNPAPPDNRSYYRVVGMSTKLRSSSNIGFVTQKDVEPVISPPGKTHCNGDVNTGLVVKFRRVRRSELSVLSDEAENFMFPKKDESDSTEDEIETSHDTPHKTSSELLTNPEGDYEVKEEILSGDDLSQDSFESDYVRRKTNRRRTNTDVSNKSKNNCCRSEITHSRSRNNSWSKSSDIIEKHKTETSKEIDIGDLVDLPSPEKCLKWEDGMLKTSPEVANLKFTFENVPLCEAWYETYKRQDEGNEKNCDIARYLGYYWKSPILPYEMGQLPPLKPNCCLLNQLKKEIKCGPSRLYGTRGMKKKKTKSDNILSLSKNPRKSPREHASTLAILGSLVHKKRNKLSSSEDTKSLPSIIEEEISNDMPFVLKLPEIQVSESSKKLEDFFSSIVDNDDFDTLVDNLDQNLHLGTTITKPDVIDLLKDYNTCEIIENTVKEMQSTMSQRNESQRRRRGYKFKKKNNRTGWPVKKRSQIKKDVASILESIDSSREASIIRDSDNTKMKIVKENLTSSEFTNDQVKEDCKENSIDQNVNSNYLVLENENSITSYSDIDEKVSNDSVCKIVTDTEFSNSEDENISNNLNMNIKQWEGDHGLSDNRTNSEGEKILQHSNQGNKDLQPIVRVQKIDTKATGGKRKLRSSGSHRKLRASSLR